MERLIPKIRHNSRWGIAGYTVTCIYFNLGLNLPYPVYRKRGRAEVFIHHAFQEIGSFPIQDHVKASVSLREKGGLHQTGFVLKSQKLHGLRACW